MYSIYKWVANYAGYQDPPPETKKPSKEDLEWYRNFCPESWKWIMKRAQRVMVEFDMDPLEYTLRLGADPKYMLGLFDHTLRPYYDPEQTSLYEQKPDMDMVITKDAKYLQTLINTLYRDILDTNGSGDVKFTRSGSDYIIVSDHSEGDSRRHELADIVHRLRDHLGIKDRFMMPI